MPEYRIGRLKGRFVVSIYDASGRRTHRYRLDARDARAAQIEAPGIVAELTRPKGTTVSELWNAFVADRAGRAIIANMPFNWKALAPRFADIPAEEITIEDCRAYTAARRRDGIKPGTISTELGRLRMVLNWSRKRGLIARAPVIERPAAPKRKEFHLTREQCNALIKAAKMPHMKLFVILALGTGARVSALLELTWDRVDFATGFIDLRNPTIERPHKGRAVVPMNRSLRAALSGAKAGALSDHVIEWAGAPVGSVKKGLKTAATAACIKGSVSPHVLRHSAAVHMAEAGISMEEIAQFLGHDDVRVTREIYARFSPGHLKRAADVLQYDDLGPTNQESTSQQAAEVPEYMVGATGIEPVTPTMSRKVAAGNRRK